MNANRSIQEADARIRHEAAEWLGRHDRGLTAAEQDAFLHWLALDPRHGDWFSRHRAGWLRLDGLGALRSGQAPDPEALVPQERGRPRFRPLAIAATVALAACALWWARPAPGDKSPATLPDGAVSVAYERRTLEDGTIVELAGGADFTSSYSAAERSVTLHRGEAFFTVARNPERPFLVQARGTVVRAVGTAFSVRLDPAAVAVLVTEGRVAVAAPAAKTAAPLVVAGESAWVHRGEDRARIARTTEAELARLRAWQPQLLDFSSQPLGEVLAQFNRRNRVQLVLADPAKARVPIVASIRSDNLEGFVSLVTAAANLRATRRGDYEIVLEAAP